MKLSNKYKLPEALVKAIQNDPYSNGGADYSITTLLKPPRVVALERKHHNDIEEDVSDRIWALYGSIVHAIIERSNPGVGESEVRFHATISNVRVSGQVDFFINSEITDFKFVTVYKFKDGRVDDDYTKQLNMYAALARLNGRQVNKLTLVGLLRDWRPMEAMGDSRYPQSQIISVDVPLWDEFKAFNFLKERIALHENAKAELPECTPEERWAKPDRWAVMRTGRSTALRVFESESEAKALASVTKDSYLEFRPGENIRCERYCSASPWCEQHKKLKEKA